MVLGQKATVTQIDRAAFGDGDRRVALLIGPAEQRHCGVSVSRKPGERYVPLVLGELADLARSRAGCRQEESMARKTVLVSDVSGKEIPDGEGASVTVKFVDARRGTIVMDVTNEEGLQIGKNGRKQARRGRPPKSA